LLGCMSLEWTGLLGLHMGWLLLLRHAARC
jgi:hypothetical protein